MDVWEHFEVEQVYRADALGVMRSGARWLSTLSFGWLLRQWHANPPNALLDNTPLISLLHRMLDLPRLDAALFGGSLHALAVTACIVLHGRPASHFLPVRSRYRALEQNPAHRAARSDRGRSSAGFGCNSFHLSGYPIVLFRSTRVFWRRFDAATGTDFAGNPLGSGKSAGNRRRPPDGAGTHHSRVRALSQLGPDRRTRDVEHFPG